MLSIGKLGVGQADYYLEAVGQGIEDYYAGAGEAPGRWLGTASAELELYGDVEADALLAVLNGNCPDGSSPLTRSGQGTHRVPGFDLTFSAPKSVSLLFGLGDPAVSRAVRDAHEAAVDAGLDYMERHAAMGRRGKGGAISVLGNGFIGAAFRHRTSRAGDPQLHTHVLIANLTRGSDGRWTALDARRLYAHARTGGFLYQAKLRLELTRRLGIEWTSVRNGVAEVDGIPTAVRHAFSRRRSEIETELKHRGETSPGAAQIAALHTRRAKDYIVPAQTLWQEWRDRARQLGFDFGNIDHLLHQSDIEPLPPEAADQGQQDLSSPAGLTARRSSFTRRDAVQAWCERLAHGGEIEEIEQLADDLLTSGHVVVLAQDVSGLSSGDVVRRADGRVVAATSEERRYSTPELLRLESRILEAARDGRRTQRGEVTAGVAQAVLTARPELSDEQRMMVKRLIGDGDQIAVVVGKAGTGKTYSLDVARQAWQTDGHHVIGAALARRAALELRDGAGIDSTSIHALLADLRERPGELLGPRTVLVVDEAGMVGTRHLAELVDHVQRAEAKLVLVGDPRQLPEIDAGGSFRSLTLRGDPIRLSDNRRQQSEWERDALEMLRSGRAGEALTVYHEHGRLVLTDTATQQRERLVEDWWQRRQSGHETIMIALRRADVAELNDRARARLAAGERLGPEALIVHNLPFAVGDEVVCLRNHSGLGITNGTRGTVTALNLGLGELTFQEARGGQITLPATYLQGTTQRGGPTLSYAYALTGHKAQGVTVDEALVLGSDALYREWGYVAMSRGRHTNRLYLVTGEPELEDPPRREDDRQPIDAATRALARSAAQISATDSLGHARIERMSIAQIERRIKELDRHVGAAERRARRERAQRDRDLRRGEEPAEPSPAPSDDSVDQRALLAAELDRRRRPERISLLVDPPRYLTTELGPVPEQLVAQRQWQATAERITALRRRAGFTDLQRALPDRLRDPVLHREADAIRRLMQEGDTAQREPRLAREIDR